MTTQAISNLGPKVPVYIRSTSYSWGVLRRIVVGAHYSIVIHPQQFWEIWNTTETKLMRLEDEKQWSVSPDNQGRSIRFAYQGRLVTVDREALLGNNPD